MADGTAHYVGKVGDTQQIAWLELELVHFERAVQDYELLESYISQEH